MRVPDSTWQQWEAARAAENARYAARRYSMTVRPSPADKDAQMAALRAHNEALAAEVAMWKAMWRDARLLLSSPCPECEEAVMVRTLRRVA